MFLANYFECLKDRIVPMTCLQCPKDYIKYHKTQLKYPKANKNSKNDEKCWTTQLKCLILSIQLIFK